jgi:hypothetical protein
MIITRLIGGLGNQMFQYAAGAALAARTGQALRLDLTSLRKYKLHQGYQFDQIFAGDFQTASKLDLFRVLGFGMRRGVRGSVTPDPRLPDPQTGPKIRQPSHNYWSGFSALSGKTYLAGYWQSPKYFQGAEAAIARAFEFREDLTGENTEIAAKMAACTSVSLHVRRGDYVKNANVNAFHGICDWPYYRAAMAHMRAALHAPQFFVFSDDLDAAKAEFGQGADITYVTGNTGAVSYRDMMLMARCKHHVIANSSFSWWGAWLALAHGAADDGQIVIAPKVWFAGSPEPMEDIYQPHWVRM